MVAKFTRRIDRVDGLAQFLALARKIIPRKATFTRRNGSVDGLPILTHICFDGGKVMASDLNNTLVMKTDLSAEAITKADLSQSFTIAFELLNKIMKQKPRSFTVEANHPKVMICYDNRKVSFTSLDVDEFPVHPDEITERLDSWNQDQIKLFTSQSAFVSSDELKPALTGVFIRSNGSLESCATDGHMLRVVNSESESQNNYELLLHPISLEVILQGSKGIVEVFEGKTHYRFALSRTIDLYVRKLGVEYPDFKRVIPDNLPEKVQIGYGDFMDLIRSSKPFVNKETKLVEVMVGKTLLKAHVNNPDESLSWSGTIPILSNDGGDCRIGFDVGFLEKLVGSINADTLTWSHNGPEKASIFSGDTKTNEINLLMPVRLNRRNESEDGLNDEENQP